MNAMKLRNRPLLATVPGLPASAIWSTVLKRARALLAPGLLLSSAAVFAQPLLWTLSNVQSVGGVTLTGSFVYDADTFSYSSINLTRSEDRKSTRLNSSH